MNLDKTPAQFVEDNLSTIAAVMIVLTIGVGLSMTGFEFALPASVTSNLCGVSSNQVQITSNDPQLGQKSWVVSAIGADNCGGESITGGWTVPAEDLKAEDPDSGNDATAERDFTFSLRGFEAFAYNERRNTESTIYDVEYKAFPGSGLAGDITDVEVRQCQEWQEENSVSNYDLDVPRKETQRGVMPYVHTGEGLFPDQTLYCFRAVEAGKIGLFESSTSQDWTAQFVLSSGGTTLTKDVTKAQAEGGFTMGSGDESVFIKSVGSLTSDILDVNLDTGRWKPAYDKEENQYKVTENSVIQDYYNELDEFPSKAQNAIDENDPADAVEDHHVNVGNIFVGYEENLEASLGSWVSNVEIDGGRLKMVARDRFALGNPVFTLRILADWVGFNINVAEPRINSADDLSLEEQSQKSTTVEIENVGDAAGGVRVSAVCSPPLTGRAEIGTVEAGQVQLFEVPISSGYSDDETYQCDIIASSTATGEVKDRTTINVDVSSTGGTPPEPPEKPENEYPNGCIDGQDNDNDGLIDTTDPDCQDREEGLPILLIVVGVLGITVLGLAFVYRQQIIESLPVGGGY